MEQIEYADDGNDSDGGRTRRGGRGVPVDRVSERADNSIEIDDEEATCTRLTECINDPERDLIDAPRSRSFQFASKFSEEFARLR